jgi:hypothetical protein
MANELIATMEAEDSAITQYDGGLSSWSPNELRAMVSQEIELRSIVVEYYRSQMKASKHFYTLQSGQKPALSKEGALNLCSLFKVRISADDPNETYHDDGHYTVRYRIHLISMRSGEAVADGDGSCSTRESKYAYRWVKESDIPGALDKTTLSKRSNQWGAQYRIPNQDLADHYNTVLKMAYKRSIVAASLCLPLVSELFTQDLEEDHLASAAFHDQKSTTKSSNLSPPSDRQKAFLRNLLEEQGNSEADVSRIISETTSREAASELINNLKARGKPENRRQGLVAAWNADKQEMDVYQPVGPPFENSHGETLEDQQDDDIPDPNDWNAPGNLADQADPMTKNQRMKLLGMFKQLGVRDGDKRELLDALHLDKQGASALIDKIVTDGADKFPWQVLSVYIGMLRDRVSSTNEDIAEWCSSAWNERHPASLDQQGRTALFEWLSSTPEGIATEEEPIDDMDEWIAECNVTSEMLSKMTSDEIANAFSAWKKRTEGVSV